MYEWITKTWNPIGGECPIDCGYCFVKAMKRLLAVPLLLLISSCGSSFEISLPPLPDPVIEISVPTAADTFTTREKKGRVAGLNVTILGDILYSRVARSNIWGLTKLGAEVAVCGPRSLLPTAIADFGVGVAGSIVVGYNISVGSNTSGDAQ